MVQGDGAQTRDFIYVKDTVCGLLLAYEKETSRGQIINLGSGIDISMNSLLQDICDYMGYSGEWEHQPERTSDVRSLCEKIQKAEKLLGFKPQMNFHDGLRETLDWYKFSNVI